MNPILYNMKTRLRVPLFTLLFTLLCLGVSSELKAQETIYFHDFGNASINTHPYVVAPGILDANLSGSSWVNSTGSWTSFAGASGQAISLNNSGGTPSITLTVDINSGYSISIEQFNFWVRRSNTGAQNWSITINDIAVGSGIVTTSGSSIGILNVSNPVTNITGTLTVNIFLSGATGSGTFRLDDFQLIGLVSPIGTDPLLTVTPLSLTDLNYNEFNGPSASQSFELSGANLDGTDVDVVLPALSDFEISADDTNFFDSLNFPAYDGTATTIYVRLKAGLAIDIYTDDITISGGGADPISVSLSGEVQPQPILGWQIDDTNIAFVLDFDNTAIGANEGQYDGSGFEPFPASGRLNSNTFATTGMSDGDSAFGDEAISGDFARGTSSGGVGTGGFYAFEVAPGNHAFGWQATGSDFAPGSITLRMQNQTGQEVTSIDVSYLIYQYNDQGRSSSLNFSYSEGFNFYEAVPELDFTSTEVASGSPVWEVFPRNTKIIPFEPIPQGEFFFLRWETADVGGSGSRDELALDNIRVIFNEEFSENYVYEAGSWSPEDPSGITNEFDILVVKDGEATLNQEMGFLDLIVEPGAVLNVEESITVNGNIISNGNLTFVSNATTTGQLDTFDGIITGEVEVQRYIPARRAFRFLSSAVSTTGSINANWQEGQNNTGIIFPDDNQNSNPGFGTHITGSQTGANGFDATPSGNPSLFTLNNVAQAWEAVTNTDVNTITAGTPYRLMVRGDRGINVTDNGATPTNTTLRTTGALHTGPLTLNDLSVVANDFNFFGNPYPAAVDINEVITASTNINSNFYYIWDPTLSGANGRGAYVTIDLSDGDGTNTVGSAGNKFLQPGQAAFVLTLANGATSLQFEETQKNVVAPQTTVFDISSQMDVRLYRAAAYAAGETPSDGLRLKFGESNTNAITSMDAPKFYNQDENLASSNDERLWSIESRALPEEGESIPLFTNAYRTTDYVFEAILTEVNDITALLRDHYTGTDTLLENNENTLYAFTIDPDDAASSATDRFEIVFEELLSTGDISFGNGFVLFPNPAQSEITLATKGINSEEVQLSITNLLGQTVYTQTQTVKANGQLTLDVSSLSQGVYVLKLTHNKGQFTTKFIKK